MDLRIFFRELFGLFLIFWALFLLLALLSFDANDPSVNMIKSGAYVISNKAGLFGAYASGFLHDFFGVGAIFWPFIFAFLGVAYISEKYSMNWWRWCGLFLLALCILTLSAWLDLSLGDLSSGGMIGKTLYLSGNHYFSPFGSILIWTFILLAGMQMAFNISWIKLCTNYCNLVKSRILHKERLLAPSDIRNKIVAKMAICKGNLIKLREIKDKILAKKNNLPVLDIPKDLSINSENSLDQHTDKNILCESIKILPLAKEQKNISEAIEEKKEEQLNIENKQQDNYLASVQKKQDEFSLENMDADEELEEYADEEIEEDETVYLETSYLEDLKLPTVDLLNYPAVQETASPEDRETKGQQLMKCFGDFDITGKLVRITSGPVVTMYEMRPDPGIRVSKISTLGDDLSLALKAVAVRIQAPIPGSDTVGIEIPNDIREVVNFRELVESEAFSGYNGALCMILGKDIAGRPYMADLAKMPHLLVAGATGAGKSVCLNSILVSFLYRLTPKDLRLLLIDPKRIEMAVYSDLPHLVHPVVTEMADAKNALEWATHEMDRRYKVLGRLGARNMTGYNQKLAAMGDNRPDEYADLEHLPYLVIVIDELADLMMTAAREVQTSILRLAALARAAGIHMILATQRPSVDVVTGLIKANILNRISFQVTSKHDSRTILDQGGAEALLGKGDMLYKLGGGRLLRLHGPFLSDEEVQAVANFWKEQLKPVYEVDFSQWNPDAVNVNSDGADSSDDPLYAEIKAFVIKHGKASISLLQREFRIGFGRSARIIDHFEKEGLIGPADGSKPRNVIVNK